jgi:hypothetical protein
LKQVRTTGSGQKRFSGSMGQEIVSGSIKSANKERIGQAAKNQLSQLNSSAEDAWQRSDKPQNNQLSQ